MKKKLILEIESEDYESDESMTVYLNALKYQTAMSELDQWLRMKVKHEDMSDEAADQLDKVREKLRECLGGLPLD